MSDTEKPFPVLGHYDYKDCPKYINWSSLDEGWAKKIHNQTLERLAQRGGLSPSEIVMNIESKELVSFGRKLTIEEKEHALKLVKENEFND